MKLMNIDDEGLYLMYGKYYEVLEEHRNGEYVTIINDAGLLSRYARRRFK